MKIDHVISTIDNTSGGPSQILTHLATMLAEVDDELKQHVHCAETKAPIVNSFSHPKIELSFYKRRVLGKLAGFNRNVCIESNAIFHGHGLWQLPVHQMTKLAVKNNVPYIISPHGMLNSWSFQQKNFKKKLALGIYQGRDIKQATCLHATSHMEANDLRELGYRNPIAVIPNGIPMDKFPQKDFDQVSSQRTVLFLSRVVENKGVNELIEAWSKLPKNCKKDWKVNIVGNGQKEYINKLRKLIRHKGLEDSIHLMGPLYDDEKIRAFHQASLFVLPTYSENFGIVVAEALACGTPVITTKGAPWEDLKVSGSGWWIDIGYEPLLVALESALSKSDNELAQMGDNGRKLIEEKYTMQVAADQMKELYDWLIGVTNRPYFVASI